MNKILNIAASPVICKNKYLLIKRIKPPYTGYWSLVGGKIEFGEHIDEAIVREVREETGLEVKFISIRGVVVEHIKKNNKTQDHFIIWVCETKAKNSNAVEKYEGEVRWFTREQLTKNKRIIIPSDYAMISAFFNRKNNNITLHKSHVVDNGIDYSLEYFGI